MSGRHLALILPSRQATFTLHPRETNDPGPGEILIRVRSTALNPGDAKVQKRGIFVSKYPAVLGSDGAGIVERVGEGVTRFDPGDDVFFHGTYDDNDLSTFQQYSIAVVDFAAKIPDNLSFDQAATVPLGVGTAAIGLYGRANGIGLVAPWKHGGQGKYRGMPIMIFGGSGSVGNYVIQLAKMSGFSPIITTAALKHANYLKSIGATHVVDRYLPFLALKQAVGRITSAPINVIYDTVSIRETQETAWRLLGPQGRLVLTSPSVIDRQPDDRREIVLTNGNPHTEDNWETGRQLWMNLGRWLETGDLVPNHVDTIPGGLKGIGAALERFENGQVDGVKMVARPQETER
ncbi:chaperonin 10-like protein [Phlebopus sp. FC_14]|nr:chaperonin 10-like protein [Phlebopus sp. FC_14]